MICMDALISFPKHGYQIILVLVLKQKYYQRNAVLHADDQPTGSNSKDEYDLNGAHADWTISNKW